MNRQVAQRVIRYIRAKMSSLHTPERINGEVFVCITRFANDKFSRVFERGPKNRLPRLFHKYTRNERGTTLLYIQSMIRARASARAQ